MTASSGLVGQQRRGGPPGEAVECGVVIAGGDFLPHSLQACVGEARRIGIDARELVIITVDELFAAGSESQRVGIGIPYKKCPSAQTSSARKGCGAPKNDSSAVAIKAQIKPNR